jgi:hypothetical protein
MIRCWLRALAVAGVLVALPAAALGEEAPVQLPQDTQDCVWLQTDRLLCAVGSNAAHEPHRAGYNGLWWLSLPGAEESVFLPEVAGVNIEHVFDGWQGTERDLYFEPRQHPIELRRLGPSEAELHQPELPFWHVESWLRFHVMPAHYVDFTYRCVAHRRVFTKDWFGVFFASYINEPEDSGIHFLGHRPGGQTEWIRFLSPAHGTDSTICYSDEQANLEFAPDFPPTNLMLHCSPIRYDRPFLYGRWRNLVLAFLFDDPEHVRFAHSPSGGGGRKSGQGANPAWDFQFVVFGYEIGRVYELRGRLLLKEFASEDDLVREYERWVGRG